jgi:hypothetical protein
MIKTILLETTDKELYSELSSKNIEGIAAEYKPVEMAFDHAIDAERIIDLVITLSSPVAINIFSNWIYDKLKRNPNQQITINGNIISGQNIEVGQINQTIENQSSN